MNLRTIFNVMFLGGLVYAIFCGYQYIQLRSAILTELQDKTVISKAIGDLSSVKVNMSQYSSVSCRDKIQTGWWGLILKHRSEGCYRLNLGLQSESLRAMEMSVDYDTTKLIGSRISNVMLCNSEGAVLAKDNGLPREFQNCK
ncbi:MULTISPECIES: hypothetical protein [Vitreoscilla]|uniref:Uncharacterized protein n=1 Tax=Vitreoscilla stercoraria TaxID=61 RepID=A0ABY4EAB9_VITST|nr:MULTISPECIES: hypothetical protein [Vitreoscilla]AUZ05919.2 hypothetical protein ADP71_26290 [Vitreoscilla sp. C1]UOO92707.1 hypothetical protein LVJ81_01275 [Vitreoscilla stercoraria]